VLVIGIQCAQVLGRGRHFHGRKELFTAQRRCDRHRNEGASGYLVRSLGLLADEGAIGANLTTV
jgi:hypothetical protein